MVAPTTLELLPVDEDEQFEDVMLPEVFMRHALDTDEASAARAGKGIGEIGSQVTDVYCRLELVKRALRDAEPHSDRARQARAHIRRALAGFEEVFVGVDEARCALILRWGTPPHTARDLAFP